MLHNKFRSAVVGSVLLLAFGLLQGCEESTDTAWVIEGGNADSGKRLLEFYDCGSCHVIPGVDGADGVVGPPLTGWGERGMIAGSLTNNPENFIAWVMQPHAIEKGTAMPSLGVTQAEARDMAAYLFALD